MAYARKRAGLTFKKTPRSAEEIAACRKSDSDGFRVIKEAPKKSWR